MTWICTRSGVLSGVRTVPVCLTLVLAVTVTVTSVARCQDPASDAKVPAQPVEPAAGTKPKPVPPAPLQPEKGWLRVAKDGEVWLDMKKKQVIVGGRICLREGMLEMFACPKGTKEHESIVSVNSAASNVHGALLALGAQAGPPVQFDPVYRPAQGTRIGVEVFWRDAEGKERCVRAQEWIKHVKTGETMTYPWVFAGSGFWTDEGGKERFYYADGGEFICVSNFSTALLDLPVESSATNDTLMFCAFTDRIPPLGTPVLLRLTPELEKPKEGAAPTAPSDGDAEKTAPEKKQEAQKQEADTGDPEKKDPEKKDPEKKDPEKKDPEKKDPETPAAEPGKAG